MNHFISLETATAMTARYRINRNSIVKTEFENSNLLAVCETFERAAFDTILSESGCEHLRIYFGMDEDLKIHAIIVAVDGEGKDILPTGLQRSTTDPGSIIENGNRCPELCPPPSDLNS